MDDTKVESIGSKKKKDQHPIIEAFYQQLNALPTNAALTAEQLKVHEAAAGALKIPTSTVPSLSASIDADSLPNHTPHPLGYNLFSEVYHMLYAPKEQHLIGKEKGITQDAKEIYRELDYLTQLNLRLKKEKTKLDTGSKEPVIEAIDFSLPNIREQVSFTKKEKTEKSDLVLNKEFEEVLKQHGIDVAALKAKADQGPTAGSSYVIAFKECVPQKTQMEFTMRIKECAALENLQKNSLSDLLKKTGAGRYDFSKSSKAELKQLIREIKDLEQVVTNRCEQLPQDANNKLTELQALHTERRLIDESMAEALKALRKLIEHILERTAQSR